MKPLTFIFSVLLLVTVLFPAARAEGVSWRAVAHANSLREEAAASVATARRRVSDAESTLRMVQDAAAYADRSNDPEARAVAAEALSEAKLGLRDAQQLLARAKSLLAAREQVVERLRSGSASYRRSPHGLVGGTTWNVGTYIRNLPSTLTPEQRAKADKELRDKLEKLNIKFENFSALEDYDFILGVAISTSSWKDLGLRVVFDQLTNGQASTELQTGYNLLRERSFDVLDCHSNGAMVCLAALSNGDVVASKVRLMGPQITPEALETWRLLLKDGKAGGIESLELYINNHDQVPAISYLTTTKKGLGAAVISGVSASVASTLEKNLQDAVGNRKSVLDMFIDYQIRTTIPEAKLERFAQCEHGGIYEWVEKCHAFDAYLSQLD
jgi:hypothetical protein